VSLIEDAINLAVVGFSPAGLDIHMGLPGEEDTYEVTWGELIETTLMDLEDGARIDTPENARLNRAAIVEGLRAVADAIEAAGLSV
jgi:hypothetical protein